MDDLVEFGAHGSADRRTLARHEMRTRFHLPPGPDGLSFAFHQSVGVELVSGHHVSLIENGRIFDALVEEIRRAKRSVHLLVYIWRPCAPSDRIVEALLERAKAGVACRVVVDPVGSEEVFGKRDFDRGTEQRLTEGGVEVHFYRLLAGRVLGRVLGRDHRKLMVVDGRVGFTGGFGLWKVWEGNGLAPEQWRDTHVRVEGPAVRELQIAFARSWQESGGDLLPPDAFPDLPHVGPARAGYVTSHGRLGITNAERMYRLVFAAAKKRLWIANAYFDPPDAMLEMLERKQRDGVDVRVLAAGPIHDVPIVLAAQRSTYKRLLQAGIRVFEYQPSMMHAKTAVVDDWLSVVGSTNLDPLSLNKLGEGSLVVANPDFNSQLAASFQRDLTHAQEITRARNTPWRRLARRLTVWVGKDR